jgi:hypothetical protein
MEQNTSENVERILADGARYFIAWFEIFVLLTLISIAGVMLYKIIIYNLYKKGKNENSNKTAERTFVKTNEGRQNHRWMCAESRCCHSYFPGDSGANVCVDIGVYNMSDALQKIKYIMIKEGLSMRAVFEKYPSLGRQYLAKKGEAKPTEGEDPPQEQ